MTGGAGFIGSHVAQAHLDRGDRVWVVDDLSSGRLDHVPREAEFHCLDIAHRKTAELIGDIRFDIVNHHAAQVGVASSTNDPATDARVNVMGLVHLLEAVRRAGVPRVIFSSSGGAIYGDAKELPTPETAPKRPQSPYAVSKLAGEHYLHYYREVHDVASVALRYGNVYGPRQGVEGEAGVVAVFCRQLLAGKRLHIYGDGEQSRDYVFVDDVARLNVMAAGAPLPGPGDIDACALNVGTGIGTSVSGLADVLETVAGLSPGRVRRAARTGEVRSSRLAIDRASGWGWTPSVNLREGLERTFESYRTSSSLVVTA